MDNQEVILKHVFHSPKNHPQAYEIKIDENLTSQFVNSTDHLYFQRFYLFSGGTIVLDEVSQGQITIKSNRKFFVENDEIRFV